MSGVYISGMEMPMNCIDCAFGWNGWCHRINNGAFVEVDMRRHDCPLIPVPDHGDLIDRDACVNYARDNDSHAWESLAYAPTIIPADKEDGV